MGKNVAYFKNHSKICRNFDLQHEEGEDCEPGEANS